MWKWLSQSDDYNQSDLKELSFVQLEKMLEPQVWREAATQVFFALGLGFGGVIAFSSYNKRDNNCHFDAALVSVINFVTSILATLVVFAVLGFKANVMNEKCVVEWVFPKRQPLDSPLPWQRTLILYVSSFFPCSNAEKILGFLNTGVLSRELIPPHINFSHLSSEDYAEMYGVIKTVKEDNFAQLGLDACVLEDELNKVWGIWHHWELINYWMSVSGLWSETWEYIWSLLCLHPPGRSGHWSGIHRLHRGHDSFPRQSFLVRHVLLHADQLGSGEHDWYHDRHHHAHPGCF